MTLDELKASEKVTVTAEDIAPILEADPQTIRIQAQKEPSKLGFPVSVIGTRVKIPRIPFINFIEGIPVDCPFKKSDRI